MDLCAKWVCQLNTELLCGIDLGYFRISKEIPPPPPTIQCLEQKLTVPIPEWFLVSFQEGCVSAVGCLGVLIKASSHAPGLFLVTLSLPSSSLNTHAMLMLWLSLGRCGHWGFFFVCVSSAVQKCLLVTFSPTFWAVYWGAGLTITPCAVLPKQDVTLRVQRKRPDCSPGAPERPLVSVSWPITCIPASFCGSPIPADLRTFP